MLSNKIRRAYNDFISDYTSEMARLIYQVDEERFGNNKRQEESREDEFYNTLIDKIPAEKIKINKKNKKSNTTIKRVLIELLRDEVMIPVRQLPEYNDEITKGIQNPIRDPTSHKVDVTHQIKKRVWGKQGRRKGMYCKQPCEQL